MFIRRSTYQQLKDRADAYAEAYVAARRAEHRKAAPAAARRTRLVQVIARYRAEATELRRQLDRKERRIQHLQGQLDDVLGLNSDAVQQGARWQERRHDKIRTAR